MTPEAVKELPSGRVLETEISQGKEGLVDVTSEVLKILLWNRCLARSKQGMITVSLLSQSEKTWFEKQLWNDFGQKCYE